MKSNEVLRPRSILMQNYPIDKNFIDNLSATTIKFSKSLGVKTLGIDYIFRVDGMI